MVPDDLRIVVAVLLWFLVLFGTSTFIQSCLVWAGSDVFLILNWTAKSLVDLPSCFSWHSSKSYSLWLSSAVVTLDSSSKLSVSSLSLLGKLLIEFKIYKYFRINSVCIFGAYLEWVKTSFKSNNSH